MKSRETQADAAVGEVTPTPAESVDTGGRGQTPIAISDGDFSTPTKRKRTITRPRGLKTLEQTATSHTPEPPVVETVAVAVPPPTVVDPPVRGPSVVDEFLAAPPTPEPEVQQRTPTPEPLPLDPGLDFAEASHPESLQNFDEALAMRRAALDLHANEDATAGGNAYHEVIAQSDASPETAMAVEAHAAVGLEPPDPDPDPDPDKVAVDHLLEQATAQLMASSDADVVVSDVVMFDESVPVAQAEAVGPPEPAEAAPPSAEPALSPLAQTLANMAEAMQGDLAEEGDIDIGDAPLLPLPEDALTTPRPRPPAPKLPPPPPRPSDVGPAADVSPVRDDLLPLPKAPSLPEALAERPRRPKRSKPWFEEVFDESYLRTLPFMTAEQTLREVDFIESSLAVGKGGEVLDVACGYGRHAIELVQRGLAVTGLDLSLPLLIRAADESQRRSVSVNFVHTDMREMSFERQFAGAYCMLTSFGYFDEESNLKVAEGIARALKPGGRFLIDVVNRDYIVGDLPARVWWEGDGCVVLEEVDFNFNTNRILTHRSVVFEDGHQLEQEISVRVYSLHELGKLLRHAGFRVLEVSGSIPTRGNFFGANSRNLLILAERRAD